MLKKKFQKRRILHYLNEFCIFLQNLQILTLFGVFLFFSSCEKKDYTEKLNFDDFLIEKNFTNEWYEIDVNSLNSETNIKYTKLKVFGTDLGGILLSNFLKSKTDFLFEIDCSAVDFGKSVGKKWLQGQKSLNSLILPESLLEIGDFSLSMCPNLVHLEFCSSIKVSEGAISWCERLRSVIFRQGCSFLDEKSLSDCKSLEKIGFGGEIKEFAKNAMTNLPSLSQIAAVDSGNFFSEHGILYKKNDKKAKLIRFPSRIGGKVKLPKLVESIESEALLSMVRVSEFEADGALKSIDGILYSADEKSLVAYPRLKDEKNFLLPSNVELILENSFCGNPYISLVVFPPSILEIRQGAFKNCVSLLKAEFPFSCTLIESDAFANCSTLEEVLFQNQNVKIGERVFANCISLKSINLPPRAAESNGILYSCSSLESVSISAQTKKIAQNAFLGCKSLKNIKLPDGILEIEKAAFANCSSLQSIFIPNSCKKICNESFELCKSLKFAFLGKIQHIGAFAFAFCESLEKIEIPSSCVEVGEGAFKCCSSLNRISVESGNSNFRNDGGILLSLNGSSLVAYPAGAKDSLFSIPIFVTKIEPSAFAGNKFLKKIEIPAGVEELKYDSFAECSALESISIPGTVKSIGAGAFRNCVSLKTAKIAEGVNVIGADAFANCPNLKNVFLPASLSKISEDAFRKK